MGGKMGFRLSVPGLELEIKLEELKRVRIHEEIIPKLLEELARVIESDGVLNHPVIVDSNTLVVLDGMHRVAALEKLGCRYLPVCLVDYQNPNVGVCCWYRAIRGNISGEDLLNLFKSLNFTVEPVSIETSEDALRKREAIAAALTKDGCCLLKGPSKGIREIYTRVKEIEKAIRNRGLEITYETEADAKRKVGSGEISVALMVPAVKKGEVLEAARSGNVFSYKTTRHVVPARPMNIRVPLQLLRSEKSPFEVNELFDEALSKRKLRRLARGTLFEGRRYEEELYVFE
jgi:hypothetical protein